MSNLYRFALSLLGVNSLFATTTYSVDEIAKYLSKIDSNIVFYDEQEIILNLEEYTNFEKNVKKEQSEYERRMREIQDKLKKYNDELTNRNTVVSATRKRELEESFNRELENARRIENDYKGIIQNIERESSSKINSAKKSAIINVCKSISEKIGSIGGRSGRKILAFNDSVGVADFDDMRKRDITHLVVSNMNSSKGSSRSKNRGRK